MNEVIQPLPRTDLCFRTHDRSEQPSSRLEWQETTTEEKATGVTLVYIVRTSAGQAGLWTDCQRHSRSQHESYRACYCVQLLWISRHIVSRPLQSPHISKVARNGVKLQSELRGISMITQTFALARTSGRTIKFHDHSKHTNVREDTNQHDPCQRTLFWKAIEIKWSVSSLASTGWEKNTVTRANARWFQNNTKLSPTAQSHVSPQLH